MKYTNHSVEYAIELVVIGFIALITTLLLLSGCSSLPFSKSLEIGIKLTGAPTYEEAKQWRKQANYRQVGPGKWEKPAQVNASGQEEPAQVLINGDVVSKHDYPFALLISGSGGCTASLVGPRSVLTAAHCVKNGGTISFKTVPGASYVGQCTHHPEYQSADHDLAMCFVNKAVEGVKPVSVVTDQYARQNMRAMILGYGCTRPGGSGGNDGQLRRGYSRIQAGQGRDLVLYGESPDNAALCFGDSGGPTMVEKDGTWQLIADNSKGNIRDRSWVTRTDRWAKEFIVEWANKHATYVCGANYDCESKPPAPGEPRQFSFKNEWIELQGTVKP